ncbi:MAG TPA: efflux RND transporter periplasmic adaptor subunit [Paracoccus sp. (in: a-proteobacteria)]|uniref:efflux RND transporter periplasmic adaptor subunit n=1 Tax=Paracoccus sp. TaxID=267 RepID=UPI002C0C05B8|nr:efflux RND transporter periplasmic adaptor subunit [Paracoccus sp. (in: a-proteobacteria)]HWL56887.1 efflux RND transporter periplasmic adaptor subunit [Paracoccus sp. (in: a-proteobacteria)]
MSASGRLITALWAGIGTAFLLASPLRAEEAGAATVTQEVPVVTTAQATREVIEARVPVTGSLVARQPVQIHANVVGREIREIAVEVGDSVKAGDVLALLDDEALGAQLAQADAEYQRATAAVRQAESQITSAEATLRQAVLALNRTRSLRQSGSAAQAALDEAIATEASAQAAAASASDGLGVAKAQLAQAEAARHITRLDLDRARILAPVDGLVVGRNAEIGAIPAVGGEPLFTMIAKGEIELAADVIETALMQIKQGDPVEVELAGGVVIPGKVRLVPAAVDPVTRLGQARISLAPDSRLRVGLFASGWVITDRREALTVPATAILADDEGERVQVLRDGMVETRPVRAGITWQGRREVLEGLEPGDEVIARAGAFFRSGDHVRAAPPASGKAP